MKLIRFGALRLGVLLLIVASTATNTKAQALPAAGSGDTFSWSNPILYQILIDRFANGDPSNDHSYGRGLSPDGTEYQSGPGFFAGGDLSGIIERIEEGYFDRLGVNALLLSSPFEQVHGFVAASDGMSQEYAYRGEWPIDFTEIDANWGSKDLLSQLVAAAHSRNIRIVLDVDMNHVGPPTLVDMDSYDFGGLLDSTDWRDWRPGPNDSWTRYENRFVSFDDSVSSQWSEWWGPDWVRAGLPGYDACGTNAETRCVSGLPDLKTESTARVVLPAFLKNKWTPEKLESEAHSLSGFLERTSLSPTPRNHLIKWLTEWVRNYGIDGFRVTSVGNIDAQALSELKRQSVNARNEWLVKNSSDLKGETDFWMIGDSPSDQSVASSLYDNGFDALITRSFESAAGLSQPGLDSSFVFMSESITALDGFDVLNSLPTRDRLFDTDSLSRDITYYMLSPGGTTIVYGEEAGRVRNDGSDRTATADGLVDWETLDESLLKHWQTLGQFRRRHPALASGSHLSLAAKPYTFIRQLRNASIDDVIVVIMGAEGRTRVNVARAFADDAVVRDAITGATAFVSFGFATFNADPSGLLLLELAD